MIEFLVTLGPEMLIGLGIGLILIGSGIVIIVMGICMWRDLV